MQHPPFGASKSEANSVLGCKDRLGKVTRMFNTVIWVYVALLIVGGLMGFIKSKSRISLISSTIFAVILALVALGKIPRVVAEVVAGFLLVFFGARFMRSKKVMPAGMMTVVSLIVLILLLVAKS
jgi:uncharacterized membrane protein (UPF0136 family)